MDSNPLASPIIEVSRSFSRKIKTNEKFELEDVFCNIKGQVLISQYDEASSFLYRLAKRSVLSDIRQRLAEEFSLAESVSGPSEMVLNEPPPGFSDPKTKEEKIEAKVAAAAVGQLRIAEEQAKLDSAGGLEEGLGTHALSTERQTELRSEPSQHQAPEGETLSGVADSAPATSSSPSGDSSRPAAAKSEVLASAEFSSPHPAGGEKQGKTSRKRRPMPDVLTMPAPQPAEENPVNGYVATNDDVPAIIATPPPREEVEKQLALIASIGPREPRKTTEACTALMRGYFQKGIPEATEENIRQFRIILKFAKSLSAKDLLCDKPGIRGYDLKQGMTQCASLLAGRSNESKDIFWEALAEQYPDAPEKILESISPDMLPEPEADFVALFRVWKRTPLAGSLLLKYAQDKKSIAEAVGSWGVDVLSAPQAGIEAILKGARK